MGQRVGVARAGSSASHRLRRACPRRWGRESGGPTANFAGRRPDPDLQRGQAERRRSFPATLRSAAARHRRRARRSQCCESGGRGHRPDGRQAYRPSRIRRRGCPVGGGIRNRSRETRGQCRRRSTQRHRRRRHLPHRAAPAWASRSVGSRDRSFPAGRGRIAPASAPSRRDELSDQGRGRVQPLVQPPTCAGRWVSRALNAFGMQKARDGERLPIIPHPRAPLHPWMGSAVGILGRSDQPCSRRKPRSSLDRRGV